MKKGNDLACSPHHPQTLRPAFPSLPSLTFPGTGTKKSLSASLNHMVPSLERSTNESEATVWSERVGEGRGEGGGRNKRGRRG